VLGVLGVGGDARFATFADRMEHRDALEAIMTGYCAAHRRDDVLSAFTEAQAAIGPVLDMSEISVDPHYLAREAIVTVGDTPMQGLVAKLSETPGVLRWPGRRLDADGDAIRADGWGE
jgi:crotonobetainyl-CoA:carnitine CoA-transferase CaiB-like acyl-CoA transferase